MKLISFVLMALLLSACSDPKDANESNFKKALEVYFESNPACFRTHMFPLVLEINNEREASFIELHNGLVEAGFLTRKDFEIPPPKYFSKRSPEPAIEYTLTVKGEQFIKDGKLCYGLYEVVSIDSFTEPADSFGKRVSSVSYTYRVSKVEAWARNEKVKNNVKVLKKDLNKEVMTGEAVFILTNNGWVMEGITRSFNHFDPFS